MVAVSDVFRPEKRSHIMASVRARGNKRTEIVVMRLLRRHGITGWRRHAAIVGHPDFAFHRERIALFVDGCFWHGCREHGSVPKSNQAFWSKKLERNRARDRFVNRALRGNSWIVIRIWQHDLASKNQPSLALRIKRIVSKAQSEERRAARMRRRRAAQLAAGALTLQAKARGSRAWRGSQGKGIHES